MRITTKFVAFLDNISEWSGKVFSWIVVPLTLLIVYEVICRRVFNAPHIWSFELTTMVYGSHFTMVAAYTLYHKRHVCIDIISNRLRPKPKTVLEMVSYLIFFFPFTIIILVFGFQFAKMSWSILETSDSTWAPPIYPLKTIVPLMALLLILQGISDFTKKLVFIIKGVEM